MHARIPTVASRRGKFDVGRCRRRSGPLFDAVWYIVHPRGDTWCLVRRRAATVASSLSLCPRRPAVAAQAVSTSVSLVRKVFPHRSRRGGHGTAFGVSAPAASGHRGRVHASGNARPLLRIHLPRRVRRRCTRRRTRRYHPHLATPTALFTTLPERRRCILRVRHAGRRLGYADAVRVRRGHSETISRNLGYIGIGLLTVLLVIAVVMAL